MITLGLRGDGDDVPSLHGSSDARGSEGSGEGDEVFRDGSLVISIGFLQHPWMTTTLSVPNPPRKPPMMYH